MTIPKILSQQMVFDGRVVKVRVDRVVEPGGQEVVREVVVHPGAVAIVARPSPQEVVLVRQYRHPSGSELVEIPAGTLQDGEDPLQCAIRELEEETGYQAAKMAERARFWTTPGFTSEFMYLFEATGLAAGEIRPDVDEFIQVDIVSTEDALRMIDEGRIQDAKSILGLLRVLK